jgi:hypothetical protein
VSFGQNTCCCCKAKRCNCLMCTVDYEIKNEIQIHGPLIEGNELSKLISDYTRKELLERQLGGTNA